MLLTGKGPIAQALPGVPRTGPWAGGKPFAALPAPVPAWSAASCGDRIAGRRSSIVAYAPGLGATRASPVGRPPVSVAASGGGASTRHPLKPAIVETLKTTISGSSGRTTSTTRMICQNRRREATFGSVATYQTISVQA